MTPARRICQDLDLHSPRPKSLRHGCRWRLGDRGEALRAHKACRAALADDLGLSPGSEMAALHVAILRDAPSASLLPSGLEPAPGPLGRLRAAMPVSYANSAGTRIVYQVIGDGPIDIAFNPSLVSNLGATWDDPTYAAFLRRLATMGRLILFDKRGMGLSDPAIDFPSVQERSDDLLAVLDAAGSERAVLFGTCGGGALCMQFAADHPQRTSGLVLHIAMARMLVADDYPFGWPAEKYQRFLAAFKDAWMGHGAGQVQRNPSLAGDPRYCEWFASFTRLAANPWMARRMAELNAGIDVRSVLTGIRAPALVLCRTEDAWLSPGNSRFLAREIANARLIELPGADHDPWVGDRGEMSAEVEAFIATLPTARAVAPV